MRSRYLLLVAALFFAVCSFAWTPEDHEIFRVRDEVNALEGKDINFYDFIGVSPSASLDELNKQYRKKSRQLHPDKAIPALLAQRQMPQKSSKDKTKKPGVTVKKSASQRERAAITKEANERYAHLGVVASILRGPARDRYDYFLKNGFPLWRGTGYYYQRFRPGLGSVLFGLFIVFGGAAHYGAMYISWKRQREFVTRYVTHARRTAWGNDSGVPGVPGMSGAGPAVAPATQPPSTDVIDPVVPGGEDPNAGMAMNRKQKRMQEKDSKKKDAKAHTRAARLARIRNKGQDQEEESDSASQTRRPVEPEVVDGPTGRKKRVIAENGKVLVVDSTGNVYLEETTEEGAVHEFLLDPDEIPPPTFAQTAVVRLPVWIYNQTLGRVVGQYTGADASQEPFLDDAAEDALNVTMSEQDHQDGAIGAATAQNANGEARKRKARAEKAQ